MSEVKLLAGFPVVSAKIYPEAKPEMAQQIH